MFRNNRRLVDSFPAQFITSTAVPSESELFQGYRGWWTSSDDTVQLALAKANRGLALTDAEQAVAYLLSDEYWRLDDIVGVRPDYETEITDPTREITEVDRFWLFVSLSWVWAHRHEATNPFETIEHLYADFSYPPEMIPFIRYMPAQPGHEHSLAGVEQRWNQYLVERGAHYEARTTEWR